MGRVAEADQCLSGTDQGEGEETGGRTEKYIMIVGYLPADISCIAKKDHKI